MNLQIEHVARAFYDAQDNAGAWESEFEAIKEQFRKDALVAIALIGQFNGPTNSTQPAATQPEDTMAGAQPAQLSDAA